MTASKGIGRGKGGGGKRPGAGRPRKHASVEPQVQRQAVKAAVVVKAASASDPVDVKARAQSLLDKAFATLVDVMDNSPFPAPRVSASKVIFELVNPMSAAGAVVAGKKEQATKTAAQISSGGRFAVPSAPKLVVDNR